MEEKKAPAGESVLEKVKKWMHSGKGRRWQNGILAAGILGIVLIGVSSFLPKGDKEEASTADARAAKLSTEDFIRRTEEKLTAIVHSIEGAGECKVMVTLENGVEYVYATEERVNTDRQEGDGEISQRDDSDKSVIVVDTGDGKQGLLVTEIQPTVKGVVIVCEGGDQPVVQQRVIDTVTTALNLSSKRVCVTKLSN